MPSLRLIAIIAALAILAGVGLGLGIGLTVAGGGSDDDTAFTEAIEEAAEDAQRARDQVDAAISTEYVPPTAEQETADLRAAELEARAERNDAIRAAYEAEQENPGGGCRTRTGRSCALDAALNGGS